MCMYDLLPAIRSLERRARYLFYCMFVCLFGQRFLDNPRADSRQILHAGVLWFRMCLLPFWGSAIPGGGKRGEMTFGWSHSWIGQLPFLFTWALPNVVGYVGHTPAHILVWNRKNRPRGFYRVGQKVRKNFEFFTISRLYVHISQKLLKIEAYKQRMEKSFISPLSKCRMCLDHRSRGSIGWAKKWVT